MLSGRHHRTSNEFCQKRRCGLRVTTARCTCPPQTKKPGIYWKVKLAATKHYVLILAFRFRWKILFLCSCMTQPSISETSCPSWIRLSFWRSLAFSSFKSATSCFDFWWAIAAGFNEKCTTCTTATLPRIPEHFYLNHVLEHIPPQPDSITRTWG